MDSISGDEARRIGLAAQGFAEPKPRTPGLDDMRRVIDRLRLIQLDSVNVLVRAHYMPFFSRLGPYRREMLDDLAYRHQYIFEQWAHVACFVPLTDYPLLHYRMAGGNGWWRVTDGRAQSFAGVLDQIRDRGPALTGELEDAGSKQGWWNWSEAKIALEYHFAHGRLAVRERRNFARVYDLPERVFHPSVLEAPGIPKVDAQREMVRRGLTALGLATLNDIRDYYRLKVAEAKPRLAELVDSGAAVPVRVEGWKEPAYLDPAVTAAPEVSATALLSPFDNLVWDRARTERMFGFFYRIEIYTPAEKRVHGYYVLPFMHDNAIVARVDLKANRQASALEVRAAHLEPGAKASQTAAALARELKRMRRWLGLQSIAVSVNGNLAASLIRALGSSASAAEER